MSYHFELQKRGLRELHFFGVVRDAALDFPGLVRYLWRALYLRIGEDV